MKEQDAARREPNNFCVTKPSTCTMNYCDENGCQDRKRNLVEDGGGNYVAGSKEQDAVHSLPRWTVSKMSSQATLMDNGCISSFSLDEICESLNELTRLRSELQQKDETIKALIKGTELYAKLRFDDQPFTPYQLALQEIESLKAKLNN